MSSLRPRSATGRAYAVVDLTDKSSSPPPPPSPPSPPPPPPSHFLLTYAVCNDDLADGYHILTPCRHGLFCGVCALYFVYQNCPICRRFVTCCLQMYIS